jgi:nitrile hydratase subunit beta
MDGIHDLGGMHGMGPINPEPNEPVFHEEWERRMFGVMMATFAGGHFNVDQFRHAIERMDPIEYLRTSYYEHWLHAVETLLVERGVIKPEDLKAKWAEVNRGAR